MYYIRIRRVLDNVTLRKFVSWRVSSEIFTAEHVFTRQCVFWELSLKLFSLYMVKWKLLQCLSMHVCGIVTKYITILLWRSVFAQCNTLSFIGKRYPANFSLTLMLFICYCANAICQLFNFFHFCYLFDSLAFVSYYF